MSWNNQGGGPWGGGGNGGGQGPWGKGPGGGNNGSGGGGPTPPDVEELIRKSQERFKKFVPSGGGSGKLIGLGVAVLVGIWAFTGFYRVDAGHQGVAMVFGKFDRLTEPGLHWNFPTPIGTTYTPNIEQVRQIIIGNAALQGQAVNRATSRGQTGDGLMLTGDQNIADVSYTVQWRITDAAKFLFNIRNPEETVRAVSISAMREVIGQRQLNMVMATERGVAAVDARDLIQSVLDDYDSGISVEGVQVSQVDPPAAVIEAFNDVQSARQDKERLENEARAYQNRVVPTARGEAQKLIQEAEAYKERVIKDAEGEAERFNQVYESYLVAQDVTRERLFLETLQEVYQGSNKIILDNDAQQGSGGVVPYLPLNELNRRPGGTN